MEEKYKMKVPAQKSARETAFFVFCLIVICALFIILVNALPFSWAFQLAVIIFCAVYINKILKQGTFITTYILYEDSLHILMRYGLIEVVKERFTLSEASFTENSIIYKGRTYPFYPDENLKKLLNI